MKKLIQIGATQHVDPSTIVVVQWNSRVICPQVILNTGQAYNATDYMPTNVPPTLETKQDCINSLLSDIHKALVRRSVMPL